MNKIYMILAILAIIGTVSAIPLIETNQESTEEYDTVKIGSVSYFDGGENGLPTPCFDPDGNYNPAYC